MPVRIDVLGNDSDPDADTLSVASATSGTSGSTRVNGDGTITYTPAGGFAGTDTFTYTLSDGAGGTAVTTVTVTVTGDGVPPTVTVSLTPAPDKNGWNNTAVTVTFVCADAESGIASCPAAAAVTTESQTLVDGSATDNAGNTATVAAAVNVDFTAPSIAFDGPGTGRRSQSIEVSAVANDVLSGIGFVRFSVDGVAAPDQTSAPFVHGFVVPDTALPGSRLIVDVLVSDRAGNTSEASLSVEVLSGGFVTGEVYDATLPPTDASPLAPKAERFRSASSRSTCPMARWRPRVSSD